MLFEDAIIASVLVLVPLLIYFYIKRYRLLQGAICLSTVSVVKKITATPSLYWRHILFALRIIAIICIVIALMRPQKGLENTKIHSEGIDIVLALDVSGSMRAEDFILNGKRYNRLHVVKEVVKEFIKKRENDRIGLVVFAGAAYTQCPLTVDYGVLLQFLDKIDIGMIEDGTAIGDGITTGINRLRKTEAKSKVVIVLTDGNNNAGKVDPANAAGLASAVGVKIYTIGAGSKGRVPFPVKDIFGNKVYQWAQIELDDATLRMIADTTGGRYFQARDTKGLKDVYDEIDALEKTNVEIDMYMKYSELFMYFVYVAMLLLLLECVLRATQFRTLP